MSEFDKIIDDLNKLDIKLNKFYNDVIIVKENEKKKFQEDYKKWFLEKEIGKEFPSGEPRLKTKEVVEEVVEEQVV